jgi:hypothetical protein
MPSKETEVIVGADIIGRAIIGCIVGKRWAKVVQ